MSPEPERIVHRDAATLAEVTAGRLAVALVDAIALRGRASVGLTGGGVGIDLLRRLARSPLRAAVDWSRVDVWWGDERFLPAGDPERNERQARDALLDAVAVEPALVHAMGGSGEFDSPEDAAQAYAEEMAAGVAAAGPWDVLLLGMGPEGHTGSVFPESPAAHETERWVVGVRGCPKPPPLRVTLTLPAMNRARQVWVVAAGADKAPAVAEVFAGAGPLQLPVAGVRGGERTLWLLDLAADGR